jgi:hypothetical protein
VPGLVAFYSFVRLRRSCRCAHRDGIAPQIYDLVKLLSSVDNRTFNCRTDELCDRSVLAPYGSRVCHVHQPITTSFVQSLVFVNGRSNFIL